MGTYSTSEFIDTFGGLPERGETYPDDPDAVIDALREREAEERAERTFRAYVEDHSKTDALAEGFGEPGDYDDYD